MALKKLRILLKYNTLKASNLLTLNQRMHNLYVIFGKYLEICKQFAGDLVNELGNINRRGVVPKFSDLEVISL
ncbi:MAG: IS982 family transposase, partial [Bacteroidales bacterium]